MFRQRWRCTVPEAVWCRQVVTSSAQKPIKRNFRSWRAWGTLLHVCVLHEGRDTWSDLYSPFYLWKTFHILQANVNSEWTVQQSNTKLTIRKLLEMNAFYKFDLVSYLYFICVFFFKLVVIVFGVCYTPMRYMNSLIWISWPQAYLRSLLVRLLVHYFCQHWNIQKISRKYWMDCLGSWYTLAWDPQDTS